MGATKRFDLQEKATDEIASKLIKYLNTEKSRHGLAKESMIFGEFLDSGVITITPPEEEPPIMQYMTFNSLSNYQTGQSIKPGNFCLNIKKLIDTIPSTIEMTVSIALDIPVLKICAALSLWKELKRVATVEISRDQAYVIVSLWKNCDPKQKISVDDGYNVANELYIKYGEPPISYAKYNYIINSLVDLKCIEITADIIWLRERISKKYIDQV